MRAIMTIQNNDGALVDPIEMALEDIHKFLGVLSFGGYMFNNQKLIVDSYYAVELTPVLRVTVNMITEVEFLRKQMASQGYMDPSFTSKLTPPFQRKPDSELN